jgi:hypothetical protein
MIKNKECPFFPKPSLSTVMGCSDAGEIYAGARMYEAEYIHTRESLV